ncbi:TVP38/TMEM64 family protein [Nocardioides sp.]|uniref:TVP38/TMEM64 family protein n=1 Tax=Nocardioides sp. TaxID=35761 RepID=UPI002B26D5C2|nr:VTT domain-containing protein [Nocardioides sp.]
MTGATGAAETAAARPDAVRRAWWRLGALSTTLSAIGLTTLFLLPLSRGGITAAIEPFGALAPVAYVLAGALLGMIFVPGPLLAGVSGALFGTGTGFVVTTCSATLSAVLTTLVSRRAGRASLETVSGERASALVALARRRGFAVVVLQRWIPGLPDSAFSYVFGAVGIGVPAVALGTVVGSAPRAFAYTALGDAAVTRDGPLALAALAVGAAISVVGLVLGALVVRRHRRTEAARRQVTQTPPP